MKEYNCPDCKVAGDTCSGCQRYVSGIQDKADYLEELKKLDKILFTDGEYDVCKNCSNNPRNGGSGICNCTIPYMNQKTGGVTYNYYTNLPIK